MDSLLERSDVWGWLLIAAALISLSLQVMHWRRGRISTAQAVTGMIARGGFLVLGIIYVTDLIIRYRRAPLVGLGIVGAGIFLHLTVNVLSNMRRRRD
jgi:hypothetical protein